MPHTPFRIESIQDRIDHVSTRTDRMTRRAYHTIALAIKLQQQAQELCRISAKIQEAMRGSDSACIL
jgi:hypothetical protein